MKRVKWALIREKCVREDVNQYQNPPMAPITRHVRLLLAWSDDGGLLAQGKQAGVYAVGR